MPIDAFLSFIYISRAVVNLLGIIGNIISFIVFCRPVFRKNSISVYCCALAIFDCFTINQLYVDICLIFDYYPPELSDIVCKIFYYITTAFSNIPAWILVAFSIDKMLSMKKSQRFEFVKTRSFQFGIIAMSAIANILIFSEVLVLLVRVPEPDSSEYNSTNLTLACDLAAMPYISIFGTLYLIIGSILPFAIMVYSSVSIVKLITTSRRKSIGDGKQAAIRRRKSRDFKFAVTSLTFNFSFIALKLPLVLYYVLSSIGVNTPYAYFNVSSLLFFINSSISFIVHFVSNSIFRKELCLLLRINTSVPVEHAQSTVITVRPLHSGD